MNKSPWKRKRLGRKCVTLGERFPALYDNNDGIFCGKFRSDCIPMTISNDMDTKIHQEGTFGF